MPGLPALCRELAVKVEAGTWRPGLHARFAVEEPKLREIFAPCFADRIVEAWLVSHMEPLLERLYIDDSYANRKGKGPLAAIGKAQKLMRQPGHVWCLQLDIKSFFCSLHRPTILKLWLEQTGRLAEPLRQRIEFISRMFLENNAAADYAVARASRALLDQVPPGKSLLYAPLDTGLPIGSVTSQHFANFYLDALDQFVKHELKIKAYLRYMDDLLLMGPDRRTLLYWRDRIAAFLARELKLALHPGKTVLSRAGQGLNYLGYRVYPHHLHLDLVTVKTLKARLDFFKHLLRPDEFPRCQRPGRGSWAKRLAAGLSPPVEAQWGLLKDLEATINSYYGLMGHAENLRLRKSLYVSHFGLLRRFFAPSGPTYASVHVKKRFLLH